MGARVRPALFSVLSLGATLASAAGIAYMMAVSPSADSSILDARSAEHHQRATEISRGIQGRLSSALDVVAALIDQRGSVPGAAIERAATEDVLVARAFVVTPSGDLSYPLREPLRSEVEEAAALPGKGFQKRRRILERARREEIGVCHAETGKCVASEENRREARRLYEGLVEADDTGAEALLGLARLDRRADDKDVAVARYRDLRERFGDQQDASGTSYALLADVGIAELSPSSDRTLELYENILSRRYMAPSELLELVAERCRSKLEALVADGVLSPSAARELERLSHVEDKLRREAAAIASLERDLDAIQRTATTEISGRAAFWPEEQALVYRRLSSGAIVGLVVATSALESLAAELADAAGLRKSVAPQVGHLDDPRLTEGPGRRPVAFGKSLPHLGVAIAPDPSLPDPLEELASARKRHRIITGGLIAVLVFGLAATVRGAARERELARLKSDFVSTVSHELKTPLTSIRMFAEMLVQGVAGEDRDREMRYHEIIVKESERLGLLIANLLDYAQIEKGTRHYTHLRASACELAREALDTFGRLREGEHQPTQLSVPQSEEGTEIDVDRDVVVQSLLNLLSNAAKYGKEGGAIELSVSVSDDPAEVELSVRDAGPGIPQAEQGRIFREFYRAPAARSSGVEGTGLGLALVKRHIEAQGGRVTVDSAVGRGATFSIHLPRAAST